MLLLIVYVYYTITIISYQIITMFPNIDYSTRKRRWKINPWPDTRSRVHMDLMKYMLWYSERTIKEYMRRDKKLLSNAENVGDFIKQKLAS